MKIGCVVITDKNGDILWASRKWCSTWMIGNYKKLNIRCLNGLGSDKKAGYEALTTYKPILCTNTRSDSKIVKHILNIKYLNGFYIGKSINISNALKPKKIDIGLIVKKNIYDAPVLPRRKL